jgi:predicted nucleic acid-binding protein
MILVDTSVWVDVLRDKSGRTVQAFRKKTASDIIVFSHFIQLELLAMAAQVLLLHRDHDFERIAEIRPLFNEFF